MESAKPVLVIDDSKLARQSMAYALRDAGFVVHELPSPIGATREIIRRDCGFVVIDIEMPALRGDKLASLFRANPRFAGVVVVLVSSLPEEELQRLASEVGADAFIPKSRLPGELVTALRRLSTASRSGSRSLTPAQGIPRSSSNPPPPKNE
jgi:DNA-binding response OmpR family regulator